MDTTSLREVAFRAARSRVPSDRPTLRIPSRVRDDVVEGHGDLVGEWREIERLVQEHAKRFANRAPGAQPQEKTGRAPKNARILRPGYE